MPNRVQAAELALAAALTKVDTETAFLADAHASGLPVKVAKCEQFLAGAQLAVAEAQAELDAALDAPDVFVPPTESVQVNAGTATGAGSAKVPGE